MEKLSYVQLVMSSFELCMSAIPGPAPVQSHIIVHSPQFMQSSGSDQTTR